MAKQLAFDEEAFQHIREGVTKLARAVKKHVGGRGAVTAVLDKSWGGPNCDQGRRDRGRRDRIGKPVREHGRATGERSRVQDSDVPADGTNYRHRVLSRAIFIEGPENVRPGPIQCASSVESKRRCKPSKKRSKRSPCPSRAKRTLKTDRKPSPPTGDLHHRPDVSGAFEKVGRMA